MAIIKTSATGNNAGFTLIEIMVVMAIIGIMLGVTVTMMGDSRPGYQLRQESWRLREVLSIAAQDAELHGREWGLIVTPKDYRFVIFNLAEKRWQEGDVSVLKRYTLPNSLETKLNVADRLTLPADTQTPPQDRPDVLLLSSGLTSAFTLNLHVIDEPKNSSSITTDGRSGLMLEDSNAQK